MMSAYRETHGRIVLVDGEISTTMPSEDGDTPAHARLAAFIANGGTIADAPPPPPPMTAEQIEILKSELMRSVDAAAEAERLKYITPGAGQAMTYSQKAAEAVAYLAAANPAAVDYPLLNAEVGITAPTIAEVAAIVKAAFDQWQIIGAQIEAARLGAKKAIAASATEAEAQAVVAAIIWPSKQN